jgi:hypothetical protein
MARGKGHEHDRIVQQIASQRAKSWQGVAVKLLAWRRIVDFGGCYRLDPDEALAFSAYLDVLRLCPGASGAANDVTVARAALRSSV